VCARAHIQIIWKKIHQGIWQKSVKKSFTQNEWGRLHIKNFAIFIYLPYLGIRGCEDELYNDSIVNLK